MIAALQANLSSKGYDPGPHDGVNGPLTMTALCLFMARGQRAATCEACGRGLADFAGHYDLLRPLRLAHFMAQVSHESARFRYMEEIASGAAYEGRRDLGNTQPGDGQRYKGRGPLQLTGRANYRAFGRALGLPLESRPEIASAPEIGIRIAMEYWRSRGLNTYADRDNIRAVTRRINGGYNGLADRQSEYERARLVLR